MAGHYARRRRLGTKRHGPAAIVYGAALTGLALLFSAAGPSATATVTVGPAGSHAVASASLSELSVPAGSEATVSANGFKPGSAVRVQIGTTPAGVSAVAAVTASGDVNSALRVPAGSRPGWDDVVLRGVAPDGHPLVEELALQVTRPASGAAPASGADLPLP